MIGLGSNRLTVCRRGGMSVTQAGRGGMEWLAGNGLRERTPYSAQATAALKAAFPTQWPTIRDYGVAHPEIVGYMNAYAPEDAKIAYSLVEGIGTRWLIASGGAYINTGVYPDSGSYFRTICKAISDETYAWDEMFGVRNSYGSKSYFSGSNKANQQFNLAIASQTYTLSISFNYGESLEIIIDDVNHKASIKGVEQTIPNVEKPSYPMLLFAMNNGGSPVARNTKAISVVEYTGYWWVPFIRNGVNGMIDVLSGTFYQNAGSGSFTISETSPS